MFDDAGLSSAAVLAAATSRAAEVCGLAQQKGRVQLGYEADLVVVDGDAQTNPSVAGRVRTVIRRGLLVPG
jgi:imidazolonepropionase-like amidohydrolase